MKHVEIRGAVAKLWHGLERDRPPREVLIDGPFGTGKTTGYMWFDHTLATKHANIRILWLRKTRESLTDSVMADFEDHVLGPQHPLLATGGRRQNRHAYHYPNGSYIRCAGCNNPEAYLSSQWDIIRGFQGEQFTHHDWATVCGRNRNYKLWFQQRGLDCNPGGPTHWILKRLKQTDKLTGGPLVERYISKHEDNPAYWDAARQDWTEKGRDYVLGTLGALPGVLYQRNRLGLWVAAEGMLWPEWDEEVHRIYAYLDGQCMLPKFEWYYGAMDFGHNAPGVLQVWGVTSAGKLYRVVEIYRTGMQLDWWAARLLELHAEYGLSAVTCDPSRSDVIDQFNDRLGFQSAARGGTDRNPWLVQPADNRRTTRGQDLGGLDLVRKYLKDPLTGEATMFFPYDALRHGPDPQRELRELPTCTEDEIPAYVNRTDRQSGEVVGDEPDDSCQDHGCDATRYAAMFFRRYGEGHGRGPLVVRAPEPVYPAGTMGALHQERRARVAREKRRERKAI